MVLIHHSLYEDDFKNETGPTSRTLGKNFGQEVECKRPCKLHSACKHRDDIYIYIPTHVAVEYNVYIIYIYIYYIYLFIYLYHDAATLQRKKLGYKTDILPRVVYNPLMFDILPACG